MRRGWPPTSRALAAGGRRRASSSRSTTAPAGASGCCSGCGWTSRFALAGLEDAVDREALGRLERLGLVAAPA